MTRKQRDALFSAAFLSPSFVLYTTFVVIAIVLGLYYTMLNWPGLGAKSFVWFRNYFDLARDAEYWGVTKNTFTLVLLAILIQNPLGLLLAILVSKLSKGYKIYRSTIFLPVVIPVVSTGLLFSLLLNNDVGFFNNFLKAIGLGFLQRNWLTDPHVVIFSVALPQVWQYLGIHFMIYLAAIQSIPKEILESALIDGASGARTTFQITLPLLWDIIQIGIILNVTGSLKAFDMPIIMTWGGPGIASSYISVLMFRYAVKGFNFSYGMTIAMTIFLYSIVFTILFKRFFSADPTK